MPKNSNGSIKPLAKENKGVHTFPTGISPKVNVIAPLEFELAYFLPAISIFAITLRGLSPPHERSDFYMTNNLSIKKTILIWFTFSEETNILLRQFYSSKYHCYI